MVDKTFGALSLCRKAGKLIHGFDAVKGALGRGEAALLLFAADLSPKTRKRVLTAAAGPRGEALCPWRNLPYTQAELAVFTRKPAGVLAVTDRDLARLFLNLPGQPDEEETV